MEYGVRRLPAGQRRNDLTRGVSELVLAAGDRVLAYDVSAAKQFAVLRAARENAGRAVSVEDTMIAAICLAEGHALATRNLRDFADVEIVMHNPWV